MIWYSPFRLHSVCTAFLQRLYCTLYTVHCTEYSEQYTLYSVQYTHHVLCRCVFYTANERYICLINNNIILQHIILIITRTGLREAVT